MNALLNYPGAKWGMAQEIVALMPPHRSYLEPFFGSGAVLNKAAILDALDKRTPKKPTFVDTRFRNHGRSVADGVSLSKCYKCPTCWSHIFHVWDSEKCCVYCGQVLDWSEIDMKG